ncbi:MAG TPA: TetR/AcrR family transcriptional regulator [Longimicrobiales bacterium]|nr:TetR/AcrR family transcriptional regulator [Longimicrobiales bacterium]
MARRRARPERRRDELIAAARALFLEKGVANTAVSDIVRAAGVAQGTFYLYFDARTDVINAVVDGLAEELVAAIEGAVAGVRAGAAAKLRAFGDALTALAGDPATWELSEVYHRPENRAVHDRMAERLLPRLLPLIEGIIEQGVAAGEFTAGDPRVAAWFILGGLHGLELAFTDREQIADALAEAMESALRSLGHGGPRDQAAPPGSGAPPGPVSTGGSP